MKKKVFIMATTASAAAAAYTHQTEAASHTVKANDSLWSIAQQYNTSVDELKKLNNLTSNLIFPNQQLKVTSEAVKPATEVKTVTTTKTTVSNVHTVQAGDSLSAIAAKYDTTYTKLMELNGLSSYIIYPGQQLKLTGQSNATTVKKDTVAVTKTTETTTGTRYRVQHGDYLAKIAEQYGVTVDEIKQWNGLTSNILYSNQMLIVSKSAVTRTADTTKQNAPAVIPVSTTQVTVKTYTSPVFYHSNLYDYGQCTWYVFNKRANIGKGISTYWWNANNWANGARNDGYTVDHTPEVGAIAQTTMGALGHVAFVERVNADGTIYVSETNYLTPSGVVGFRTLTKEQMSQYVFIH